MHIPILISGSTDVLVFFFNSCIFDGRPLPKEEAADRRMLSDKASVRSLTLASSLSMLIRSCKVFRSLRNTWSLTSSAPAVRIHSDTALATFSFLSICCSGDNCEASVDVFL